MTGHIDLCRPHGERSELAGRATVARHARPVPGRLGLLLRLRALQLQRRDLARGVVEHAPRCGFNARDPEAVCLQLCALEAEAWLDEAIARTRRELEQVERAGKE